MIIEVWVFALLALVTKIKAVSFIAEVNSSNFQVWLIWYNQLSIERAHTESELMHYLHEHSILPNSLGNLNICICRLMEVGSWIFNGRQGMQSMSWGSNPMDKFKGKQYVQIEEEPEADYWGWRWWPLRHWFHYIIGWSQERIMGFWME